MKQLGLADERVVGGSKTSFRKVTLPANNTPYYVPDDIEIHFPDRYEVLPERLHLLAHIPWSETYLRHVPPKYHDFFSYMLPHLGVRTTDVHTAHSVSFVRELIDAIGRPVDEHVIYIALIVHDCGWSKLTQHDIADSLDYSGIAFTAKAATAKAKHTIYGSAHAFQLLTDYMVDLELTLEQMHFISDVVRYHERPYHYSGPAKTPLELIIACEADRLWPFTHENFWLDTIRKGVEPTEYIENVAAAVDEMLLTKQGRAIATRLVAARRTAVRDLTDYLTQQATF